MKKKIYKFESRIHLEKYLGKYSQYSLNDQQIDDIESLYLRSLNDGNLRVLFDRMTFLLRFAEDCDYDEVVNIFDIIATPVNGDYDISSLEYIKKIKPYGLNKESSKCRNLSDNLRIIENNPGVYKLYNHLKHLIYIGKSTNLGKRIPSSAKNNRATYFSYIKTETTSDMHFLEVYLISKHKPPLNNEFNEEDSLTLLPGSIKINLIESELFSVYEGGKNGR